MSEWGGSQVLKRKLMLGHRYNSELHGSVLALSRVTPFNMVTELLQYVSSLVYSEVRDPKVMITGDYQSFTVGTQMMLLDMLRHGLKQLINCIWMAYSDIMQSARIVPEGIHVADDLSNNSQGYSFLEESPFHDKQWEMFSHLMATYRLVSMDYTGNLCWDIP